MFLDLKMVKRDSSKLMEKLDKAVSRVMDEKSL